MGFNKRYASGQGILAAFERKGVEGVQEYFRKPDAVIVPSQSWANEISESMKTDDAEALGKMLQEGSDEVTRLRNQGLSLKESLGNETDPQLHSYITANLENIDKKLGFYK